MLKEGETKGWIDAALPHTMSEPEGCANTLTALTTTVLLTQERVMAASQSIPLPSGCKEIPSFPGYAVSAEGNVWSRRVKGGGSPRPAGRLGDKWRRLKPHMTKGYLYVNLVRPDGKQQLKGIHTLILEAFVGPCPPGMEACHHPDPTKTNNNLDNLRWDTPAENLKDRARVRVVTGDKACTGCGIIKPLGEFYHCSRVKDGRMAQCKPCHIRASNEARARREGR